ncbi:MAG: methyltransferase family protein [Bacteroidales bacterium]
MTLYESFEKSGNLLFRFRSYIPVFFAVTSIPVVLTTPLPVFPEVWTTLSVIVVSVGFVVRAYTIGTTPRGTSGRNTRQQVAETLNTSGIYSIVRHPLYLGNYLMWAGLALFTFNLWYFIIISLVFWLYYERIMYAEEMFLLRRFGNEFTDWAARVPAFIPQIGEFKSSSLPFSFKSVLRREYSGLLAVVSIYCILDYFRAWIFEGNLLQMRFSLYAMIMALFVAGLLRTLKHHTHLLEEEGRS